MPIDWQVLRLTIELAVVVSAILFAIGLPLAYWIAFSARRWKFLVALGSQSPLGRWWQSLTGHTLAFTFTGLVIGSVLYSLPFAVQPFAASFSSVDRKLLAASATLGASAWRTFFRILVPLSVPGLVPGVALAFVHPMGKFGVVLMIGGNIPGVTRTMSIDIYDRVQSSDYAGANAMALLLLIFCFAVLAVVYGLNRRTQSQKLWTVGPVK